MAAKPPKTFDVWFVTANTVYRAVPYTVVADWTQQGRLAEADMLRPAGTEEAWKRVAEWTLFTDYLPHPTAAAVAREAVVHEPVELPDAAEEGIRPRRRGDEDDDVDMIPLIDISMVLLVFFIIVSATGALSPVDVPDMKYAGDLVQDADAITINIEKDKANDEKVNYSVRTGKMAPKPENASLPNPEAALAALDAMLADRTKPPEVRIACEKDLPSARVAELALELKKRFDARKINSFVATVNEAKKK